MSTPDDDIALVAIDHRTRTVNTIARACPEYTHELAETGDVLVRLPGWVVRGHIRCDEPVSVDALLTLAYGARGSDGSPRDRIAPAPAGRTAGRTSHDD